jgi:hypothetical protein
VKNKKIYFVEYQKMNKNKRWSIAKFLNILSENDKSVINKFKLYFAPGEYRINVYINDLANRSGIIFENIKSDGCGILSLTGTGIVKRIIIK